MIKIPGTDEGVPAIERGDRRGHQRQRHAAVQRRGLHERSPRPTSAGIERRLEAGESLDVHSVASFFVSRVDTEVDKRLEALGREDLLRHRRGRQRARRLRSASRRSSTASASPSCARRARRCSGRCGPRPASRTRTTRDTKYVDGLVAPRHRQHDADGHAAAPAPSTPRSTGPTADQDPSDGARQALADAGIDMTDVTDRAAARGHREVRRAVRQADRRRRVDARGASSPAARRRSSRSIPDELEPAIAERVQAGHARSTSRAASGSRTSRSGAARACPRSATGSAG